jgi:proteasome-associated ATPase
MRERCPHIRTTSPCSNAARRRSAGRQTTAANNERLAATLREARDQIVSLKAEVDRSPAAGQLRRLPEPRAGAHRRHLHVRAQDAGQRQSRRRSRGAHPGREVMVNEALNVVDVLEFDEVGEVVLLKEVLDDGDRAWSSGTVTRRAWSGSRTGSATITALRRLLADRPRVHFAYERMPKLDVEELVLEEVPDIDYSVIGGLGSQIEAIRDAVELPFLHKELFAEHELKAPKGILLYGPPGCGKTLIAKAVANSLAKKVTETTGEEGAASSSTSRAPSC